MCTPRFQMIYGLDTLLAIEELETHWCLSTTENLPETN